MRRAGLVAGWFAAMAGAAVAQEAGPDVPELRRVTGVAAGDVLNLRAAPSASAPVIGRLARDARGVEVLGLSADGLWARVPLPEGEAWARLRYLAADGTERWPLPMRCLGTEPFWALDLRADGATWSTPEGSRELRPIGGAEGFAALIRAFDDDGQTRDLTVVRGACSDGMSDRPFGLRAIVWARDGALLEGCCTIDRR